MLSIRARLLAAGSLVLLGFVILVAAALESAFQQSARDAEEGRLRGLVYALLGAAEPDADGRLTLPDPKLPEPRLREPQSDIEAAILDASGAPVWRSRGSGPLPALPAPPVGAWRFERLPDDGRFALSFGLRWIGPGDLPVRHTVLVLEDPESYDNQLGTFRRTLRQWLYGAALGLLATLLLVLAWGLAPLRRLVAELRGIESGAQAQIDATYPGELTPLISALNAMIRSERSQIGRHRNALGDLAHSLKTPLAVLRGLGDDARLPAELRGTLEDQVGRMQQIADHQLGRAALAGRRTLAEPILLPPLVERIVQAMRKVHAAKPIQYEVSVAGERRLRATESDFLDLLGNLADNAAKWGRSRVRIEIAFSPRQVSIAVDDDGPGFPPDAGRLLERGIRADTRTPGHGIGLAHVAEIVKAYEGTLQLGTSALGGARVSVRLPT